MKKNNYFNRDLSWLEFNYRVLEEALDKEKPVFERLKFLSIFSNNLDEFVMVRVSSHISNAAKNSSAKDFSGETTFSVLKKIQNRIAELAAIESRCFTDEILKEFHKKNISFYTAKNIPGKYLKYLKNIFLRNYYLILTPMAVDQARPFPFLKGKSLNILLKLKDPLKKENHFAVIPVPVKERFIRIPDKSGDRYIYIEELIKLFAEFIFKGYQIRETCTFRITRDAEISIDEEEAQDFLVEIEEELKKREKGFPIRLEVEEDAGRELVYFLKEKIKFCEGFYFPVSGPLDLSSFFSIVSLEGFEKLKDPVMPPVMPREFKNLRIDIFRLISAKDRLIHLPYESFDPVERFIIEAGSDPKVLAIKMTLYRTSYDSPVITALKKAASNGKQVTVLIELRARFDEARNIHWAKQLEKSGCHVVYGLVGLKIHCKIALVMREEQNGIKRYCHISTGNYNNKTAKVYTDIGLFTAERSFADDVSAIFNLLTGFSQPPRWKKLVCAPLDLRNFFIEKINMEISNVKNGGKGRIIAKINSLTDIRIIDALYIASKEGVIIDLIVRGICCLKPQDKELSRNITVLSIVDRFLEHSRIFYFYNAGEENIYLSSADWMERNLDSRVEILFPLESSVLKNEIMDCFNITLKDNKKARVLLSDGKYIKKQMKSRGSVNQSQADIYDYYVLKNRKIGNKIKTPNFIPKMNSNKES